MVAPRWVKVSNAKPLARPTSIRFIVFLLTAIATTGLYTKCLQIAAEELRVPLEAVFTSETATNTVPNTVPTAASAGSDLNGYAILNACRELNTRLAPFREELGEDAPMAALAGAAWGARVSLSTTGHYATPNLGYVWNCQERTGDLFHCA